MRRQRTRPLTVLDIMILVGASAIGFGLTVSYWRYDSAGQNWGVPVDEPFWSLDRYFLGSTIVLSTLVVAHLVLRLRKPRRPFRRIALRPDMAPLYAIVSDAIVIAPCHIARVRFLLWMRPDIDVVPPPWIDAYTYGAVADVAPFIMFVWFVLVAAGRWRVRGWVEWLGVALGSAWIAHYLLMQIIELMP